MDYENNHDVFLIIVMMIFQQLMGLVIQLAIALTTTIIDCTLNGFYNILHH